MTRRRSSLFYILLIGAVLTGPAQAVNAVSCSTVHNFNSSRFTLLSGDQFPPMKSRGFAKVSPAKDWSPEERAQIQGYIDEISRIPGIQPFLDRVGENGFDKIYRLPHRIVEHSRFFFFPAYLVRKRVAANTNYEHGAILIYDSFFKEVPALSFTGILGYKSGLLHELAHAFDLIKYSLSDEFLKLTGWRRYSSLAGFVDRSGYVYQLDSATREQIDTVSTEYRKLLLEGKEEEAFALERKFAHKRGFPTLYSMQEPQESFADMVAAVLLDPNVETYMKPELVRWIRQVIFHPY